MRKNFWPSVAAAAVALVCMNGCHSYHIEATIENHTGGAITLLEVDYPSASFGADTLAADGVFRHSIQTRGSGPISVQYTSADGHSAQIKGPTLYEGQDGKIEIDLQPGGKAEFHPALTPQH
ncbi:MAG: hypothetical protein WBQ95_20220 [Terracidiphilus sp.]